MNVFAAAVSSPLPELMPPADFDLEVSLLGQSRAAALVRAVQEGKLEAYICLGRLWVRRADVQGLLPPGHCTYDQNDDCCFIATELTRFDN